MGKRYKVSAGRPGCLVTASVVYALFLLFLWWLFDGAGWIAFGLIPIGIYYCAYLYSLYELFTDGMSGTFTVDEKGITMRAGVRGYKSYFHPWDSLTVCDATCTRRNSDSPPYFIYFASRHLTTLEKQQFEQKTKRDLKNLEYFE